MPIYEYYSPDTHKIYSFLARSLGDRDRVPRCPDGPAHRMQKAVSQFAFLKGAPEGGQPGDENLTDDDRRMEAALGQLEHEFHGIDENNPDPRQLAHLMRRLQDVTGQKLPASMQEMLGRLDAGEDPEGLEDLFGDELEGEMGDYASDRSGEATSGPPSTAQRLRDILREARRREPTIDPTLYDLTDWL